MSDPAQHELTVPAKAGSLKSIRGFLKPLLQSAIPEQADNLVLALDEACANVVRHRSPELDEGEIHLRCEVQDKVLRFQLDAFCHASEMGRVKPRELEDVRPGGLGMHFISEIMDRVYFIPNRGHEGSVTLVMEKDLSPSHTPPPSDQPHDTKIDHAGP